MMNSAERYYTLLRQPNVSAADIEGAKIKMEYYKPVPL